MDKHVKKKKKENEEKEIEIERERIMHTHNTYVHNLKRKHHKIYKNKYSIEMFRLAYKLLVCFSMYKSQ